MIEGMTDVRPQDGDPDARWVRLGDAVRTRRHGLGLTLEQTAARTHGIGSRRLGEIERGAHPAGHPRSGTLLAIDRALGWQDGSCLRLLAGGEPVEVATLPANVEVVEVGPQMVELTPGDRVIVITGDGPRLSEPTIRQLAARLADLYAAPVSPA
jgi:hypothetical protein